MMGKEPGRKLHSLGEAYWIVYQMLRSAKHMGRAKRSNELSQQLIERIMLALTEVNSCPLCSFAHTKMALESGMSSEEIKQMLSGVTDDVPTDELPAVMFAQHYADSRANPSPEAWQRLVDVYGVSKAKGILGATRAIMFGNAYGIPWGSFFNRFKGKPDSRCTVLYEAGMILSTFVYLPMAFLHGAAADLAGRPLV